MISWELGSNIYTTCTATKLHDLMSMCDQLSYYSLYYCREQPISAYVFPKTMTYSDNLLQHHATIPPCLSSLQSSPCPSQTGPSIAEIIVHLACWQAIQLAFTMG